MTRPDVARIAAIISEAAAEEIVPRFGRLEAADIREKAPGDLVTVADTAMEARLAKALTAALPGSVVLGEEAAAADPRAMALVSEPGAVWIVDPVDGTQNFAAARPYVAVIVALLHDGEPVGAWIHDPLQGRMATAEAGSGAFLDGVRLQVAAPAPPSAMHGFLNTRFFPRAKRDIIEAARDRIGHATSYMCAGREYIDLTRGAMHFALYRRTKPWDHVAGAMMHREAGGYSARHDGQPYGPASLDGGLLLAPDRACWEALYTLLLAPLGLLPS